MIYDKCLNYVIVMSFIKMHLVGIFPPNVSIGFCDTLQFSVSFPWFSKLRDSTTFFSHSMIGIVCLCVAYAFFFLSFFLSLPLAGTV